MDAREHAHGLGCPRVRQPPGLKLTGDGEVFDVVSTASQLDYDPVDQEHRAAEYEAAKRGGCDRMGIWHPVFTLCGRVHGYFAENEGRLFEDQWRGKYD